MGSQRCEHQNGANMGDAGPEALAMSTPADALVMVTGNKRKFARGQAALGGIGREVVMVDLELVEVQADSVADIARDKCRQAWERLRRPLIVTDYGLEVDCLKGFPGPYTDYVRRTVGCDGLIRLAAATAAAQGLEEAAARWRMGLVYADAVGEMHAFELPLEGRIAGTAHITPGQRQDDFLGVFVPRGHDVPLSKFPADLLGAFLAETHNVYKQFAAWLRDHEPHPPPSS
eukprot:TRINITY_DN7751_c0_g2_i1.p2 TRINITY_DN7751_c0_g2~~TRINITY_DN7751_c0_g2_i1.p2  ORF type:complete len:231 (+),score=67.20 TRINITY_DN7751_c0_g2_i1:178-870(+)